MSVAANPVTQSIPSGATQRRTGWRQFSLRRFLVGFTLLAVAMALWSDQARRQQHAVRLLRERGCEISYDFEVSRSEQGTFAHFDGEHKSPFPRSLVEWLGVDYFHRVCLVILPKDSRWDDLLLLSEIRGLRCIRDRNSRESVMLTLRTVFPETFIDGTVHGCGSFQ